MFDILGHDAHKDPLLILHLYTFARLCASATASNTASVERAVNEPSTRRHTGSPVARFLLDLQPHKIHLFVMLLAGF